MVDKKQVSSIHRFLRDTAWTAPEVTAWSFGSYEVLLPNILKYFHCHIPQFQAIDMGWGLLDGVSCVLIGVTQLTDIETHRYWSTRIRGSTNIISGIQLIVLTALLSPVVPIAFAATALTDFVLSLDPLIHAWLRLYNTGYKQTDDQHFFNKTGQSRTREEDLADVKEKTLETLIFAIAAVGWTLMLIPGMQIPAVVFVAAAIVLYFGKNNHQAYQYLSKTMAEEGIALDKTPH